MNIINRNFKINKLVKYFFMLLFITAVSCADDDSGNGGPDIEDKALITEFSFLKSDNPNLKYDVHLDIEGDMISGRVYNNTGVDNLMATIAYSGAELTVSNVSQTNGTTRNDFTDVVVYTVKAADGSQKNYEVDVAKFTGLPIIYLNIDGGANIDSKEDYIEGDVWIDGGRNFEGLESSSMKIRGRGNSTWGHPKKPYQMKLSDKSAFLGMPENKKWLFLAEYSDKTMIRNTISFEMGYISNLDWTPESTFAEVYLNDEYNGTYNITQKVEEGDDRVVLGDTGYLLEIDQLYRLDPDDVYFYTDKFLINIKEPELAYDSPEFNLAKDLLNEFEQVLFSDQFKDPVNGYQKYIDLDSFIDWYLISEITKNVDSKDFSSIFLNVIPGEKIKMGPLWDFDLSFGNVDYADSRYAEGFWVKDHDWYSRLFEDDAFVEKIKTRFAYFRSNQDFIIEKMEAHAENLKWAQQENDSKWKTIGVYVWPNPVVFSTYDAEVKHMKSWYIDRMNWLENAYNGL